MLEQDERSFADLCEVYVAPEKPKKPPKAKKGDNESKEGEKENGKDAAEEGREKVAGKAEGGEAEVENGKDEEVVSDRSRDNDAKEASGDESKDE